MLRTLLPPDTGPSRRSVLRLFVAAGAGLHGWPLSAQVDPREAAVHKAILQYEKTWNRHDVNAWAALLTHDVDYRYYEWGEVGRPAAIASHGYEVRNQDLKLEVRQIKFADDGTATVVLRGEFGVLPKKSGKYSSVLAFDRAVGRWRQEGGQWHLAFFTWFEPRVAKIMQKEGLQ